MLQAVRVTAEAEAETEKNRRIWEAFLNWRSHPPMKGKGVVAFDTFLGMLGLSEAKEVTAPEISNAELEGLMKQGRMGLFPPGVKG